MRALSPAARLAFVGVSVVGLLAVVGLASRGGFGGGGSGHGPPASLLDYGFSIFLVAYVVMIPLALWAFVVRQRRRRLGGGEKQGLGLLSNLVVFVALVAAALALVAVRHSHSEQQRIQLPPPLSQQQDGRGKPDAVPREPRFRWSVVAAAVALGAGGIGVYLVARRRRQPLRPPAVLTEELAFALDDAIDGVRAEADPRRAVIKAYARMEQILGAHGLPRAPAEAPYEYLARALGTLDASARSVERLTDLFERAKFSLHEIGPELREQAIEALTAVRDELRAGAGPREPQGVSG